MTAQQDAADARLTMLLALRLGGVDHTDAVKVLDEYDAIRRNAALAEAADELERIANQVEATVAEHYGPASGIGPGSAAMVRESARTLRDMATGGT